MLKCKVDSTPSVIARRLLLLFAIASALLLIAIWPLTWLNAILLFLYLCSFVFLNRHSSERTLRCEVMEDGKIVLYQPESLKGVVSKRSFYNHWIMMLCIEIEADNIESIHLQKHNNERRWLIVFSDNVPDKSYRFIARIICQAQQV